MTSTRATSPFPTNYSTCISPKPLRTKTRPFLGTRSSIWSERRCTEAESLMIGIAECWWLILKSIWEISSSIRTESSSSQRHRSMITHNHPQTVFRPSLTRSTSYLWSTLLLCSDSTPTLRSLTSQTLLSWTGKTCYWCNLPLQVSVVAWIESRWSKPQPMMSFPSCLRHYGKSVS